MTAETAGRAAVRAALSGTEKATTLLIALGKPLASRLLSRLKPAELKQLIEAPRRPRPIETDEFELLVSEFRTAVQGSVGLLLADNPLEELAREALGGSASPAEPEAKTDSAWVLAERASAGDLVAALEAEPPQAVAIALAQLSAATTAKVLAEWPAATRSDLIARLLGYKPVPPEVLDVIESALRSKLQQRSEGGETTPPHVRVAAILNKLDETEAKEILAAIEAGQPDQVPLVRSLMFSFEDIARLSAKDRSTLFDKVAIDRTVLALAGASAGLRELILASMSARAKRMVMSEMEAAAAASAGDIKAAMRTIADLALELSASGEITLGSEPAE